MPVGLFHVRAMYEECRRILVRQQPTLGSPSAKARLAYMISRLDFAIHALVEKELLSSGSVYAREARTAGEAGDNEGAERRLAQARDFYRRAIDAGETALRAAASQVRDDSDRACLAAYYHFFVREIKERTAAVT